jgi:hypothetical protein
MTVDQNASVSHSRKLALAAPPFEPRMTNRMIFTVVATRSHAPHRIAGRRHPKTGARIIDATEVTVGASWSPTTHVRYRTQPEAVLPAADPVVADLGDDTDLDDRTMEFELVAYDEPDEMSDVSPDAIASIDSDLSIFTFKGTVDVEESGKSRRRRRRLFSHR